MSSKQSSKTEPRIPPKEVMVTRHKSAQMKRQLRVKNRSMKHLTDLLKSPSKETLSNGPKHAQAKPKSPKIKQSLLKSVAKVQKLPEKVFTLSKMLRKKIMLIQDEEYYPNKMKRKTEVKKVMLKPSHDLKMVGSITGSVKRKSTVPHKASKTPKSKSPVYAELSMAEVIRMVEDDLTDEDMMEILTCPSPVWWEDPPDEEEYIEDAIFIQPPEKAPETKIQEPDQNKNDDVTTAIEMPNLTSKGDKFLKKRSKLEDLLGNIKNNSNKVHQSKKHLFNDDVVVMCSNHRKNNDKSTNDTKNETDNDKKDATIESKPNVNKRRQLSESDGEELLFHDTSMNDDELLRDLENMDIPIENDKQNDVIVIDDDDDLHTDKETKQDTIIDKKHDKRRIFKPKNHSNDNLKELSKNVPVLQKCVCSPKSSDSSKSTTSGQETDTISDTNIRFLDDVTEEKNSPLGDEKSKTLSRDPVKLEQEEFEDEADPNCVVYKIIEEIPDNPNSPANTPEATKLIIEEKEEKSPTINDYYKKCKKVYQKKIKKNVDTTDINKNETMKNNFVISEIDDILFCESCKPNVKKVSDDKNVKYCLKCSSIFDSTVCTYCIDKCKEKVFTCDICSIKFCCEINFKNHAGHGVHDTDVFS